VVIKKSSPDGNVVVIKGIVIINEVFLKKKIMKERNIR